MPECEQITVLARSKSAMKRVRNLLQSKGWKGTRSRVDPDVGIEMVFQRPMREVSREFKRLGTP